MRIGILTFHFADNYGAILQCLALAEACRKHADDVCVIDYVPKQMVPLKSRVKRFVLKNEIQKKFDDFKKTYFRTISVKESCDLVIVGSDQVWNPQINECDPFWILPKMKYKRICSYAASIGKDQLQPAEAAYLSENRKGFEKYDVVTIRENSGKKMLEKLQNSSELVCDPTMLFYDRTGFYEELSAQSEVSITEPYILVYALEYSKKIDRMANLLKQKTGCKVVAIHPMNDKLQECDEFIKDAGVCEFVALVKNAEYVLTNSFHGLAFSYIFRKKVYCFHHSSLSSRQAELIKKSEFVTEQTEDGICYIDAAQRTDALDQFVSDSEKILKRMIKG